MTAKRSKRKPESAAETLDQLESLGDRFAGWIGENPYVILGTAAGILLIAGAYGLIISSKESALLDGATDLARLESEYRASMGATEDDLDVPEPANPETALRVRTAYAERFAALQRDLEGEPAAALAAVQLADIQEALGETDAALASLDEAIQAIPSDNAMHAILLRRKAVVLENRGVWTEAAEAYEAASAVVSFPLRYDALGDAARCYAEAGQAGEALAVFARIENEAPDHSLPEHVESRLRELRARQARR